jgi:tetratricopeptide (TPR) repeat protein
MYKFIFCRYWFREGTNSKVGAQSIALWTAWGNMEWKAAGDSTTAGYCFDMALKVFPKSRYALLSYATMEKALGNSEHAVELLTFAAKHNPTDAPVRQVLCLEHLFLQAVIA